MKRQLRFLLEQSPEALRLLAQVEVQHSWWLFMQGRTAEACAGNWRALNLTRGTLAPDHFCVMALNLLSAQAAQGARGPENGERLLSPWLRLLPPALHPLLLCDMALYAGLAQRQDEASSLLERARRALPTGSLTSASHEAHFRLTTARVLLSAGKPVEALTWLPETLSPGDGRIHELLIWDETYLAAHEHNAAARCLNEAQMLLAAAPLPARQRKWAQLAQQL